METRVSILVSLEWDLYLSLSLSPWPGLDGSTGVTGDAGRIGEGGRSGEGEWIRDKDGHDSGRSGVRAGLGLSGGRGRLGGTSLSSGRSPLESVCWRLFTRFLLLMGGELSAGLRLTGVEARPPSPSPSCSSPCLWSSRLAGEGRPPPPLFHYPHHFRRGGHYLK